jgi:hypothetical protein
MCKYFSTGTSSGGVSSFFNHLECSAKNISLVLLLLSHPQNIIAVIVHHLSPSSQKTMRNTVVTLSVSDTIQFVLNFELRFH